MWRGETTLATVWKDVFAVTFHILAKFFHWCPHCMTMTCDFPYNTRCHHLLQIQNMCWLYIKLSSCCTSLLFLKHQKHHFGSLPNSLPSVVSEVKKKVKRSIVRVISSPTSTSLFTLDLISSKSFGVWSFCTARDSS